MKKVKITLDKELAAEYGVEGITPCPMLKEGQVFYGDYAKPDGFCAFLPQALPGLAKRTA